LKNKHLVLVGAGHPHLHLLKNAFRLQKQGLKITLISPTDFYYNGLAPGVLSRYYSQSIGESPVLCHLEKVNGQLIEEKVVGINVGKKTLVLSNGETISYDIVSFNLGANGKTFVNENSDLLFPTRPVSELWSFQNKLENLIKLSPNHIKIAIIGAGAAGVELAGNIHQFIAAHNIQPEITLISRSGLLLPQFSSSAGSKVIKTYKKRGIQILLKKEVIKIQDQRIKFTNHDELIFDLGISATGIIPNTIESQNTLETTPLGELIVTKYLQCKNYSTIFAAGDCVSFEPRPLWKSGFHAIYQGPVLLHNILAIARNSKLRPYKPRRLIITALNLGDGTGLGVVGRFTYHGTLAFKIKDYWERRFLRNHRCE
jgi:NADH dehydrogenase FAD-containing subunit